MNVLSTHHFDVITVIVLLWLCFHQNNFFEWASINHVMITNMMDSDINYQLDIFYCDDSWLERSTMYIDIVVD